MAESSDSSRGENSYAVIETSFLDGLSPLECFVHALSCRSNMFSVNAEVPGTLTRKIMFYMRDVYLAYDGTVRNAYGQQLIQFSYGSQMESSNNDCKYPQFNCEEDSEFNGLGGQPVGSLAACSISKATYGALDQPVNSLEPSPLLSLKKVLQCSPTKASVDQTATLILSAKLNKLNYGFEYGALAVKNHLDRVFFSDIVTSVRIIYNSHYTQGAKGIKLSPWITHFHLNKERMMRKRTTLRSILKTLNRESALLNPVLPRLFVTSRNCCLDNEQKVLEENCISVAIEDSRSSKVLDIIRDSVIPALLNTHIKGFIEFKQVDILWDSESEPDGQLILKVAMSEECSRGKFWQTVMDACVPIMHLIDWELSHPDGVYGIYEAFGINAAWNYFLGSLKLAVSDVGRTVSLEHLLLVSDSLSVTGEFHGLSAKGLKKQRAHLFISTPFTQACFSNPERGFFDAAKQSSVDCLYGMVDILAWGVEAPVGTGGPFKLMYSEKAHNQIETEDIYGTLLRLKPDKTIKTPSQINNEKWKRQQFAASARGSRTRWDDSECSPNKKSNVGFNSKFLSMSIGSWANIMDMMSSLREILHIYSFNDHLNAGDKSLLMEALLYYPKKDVKIGVGIKEIKVIGQLLTSLSDGL